MKENVIQFFFTLSITGPSAGMQGGLFLKACPRIFQVSVLATWTSDRGEGCTLIRRSQLVPCSSRILETLSARVGDRALWEELP